MTLEILFFAIPFLLALRATRISGYYSFPGGQDRPPTDDEGKE